MKIGLYGLAGFGAYAAYEHFTKDKTPATTTTGGDDETASFTGTKWQRRGYGGTNWQNQNLNFTGTGWQNSGRDKTTSWQRGNVFSNAAGDHPSKWMVYARSGKRQMYPVHPPLYEARFSDKRPDWMKNRAARGRYMNQAGNLQGTAWQTTNMSNACGSCAG